MQIGVTVRLELLHRCSAVDFAVLGNRGERLCNANISLLVKHVRGIILEEKQATTVILLRMLQISICVVCGLRYCDTYKHYVCLVTHRV